MQAKEKQQGDLSKEGAALAAGMGLSLGVLLLRGPLQEGREDKLLTARDAITLAQMSITGYGAMQS